MLLRLSAFLLFILTIPAWGEVERYDQDTNWKGYWLSNDHIQVFVSIEPSLRILHLSTLDGINLLRDLEDDISGIKTGYLSPTHQPDSFFVGDQKAKLLSASSHSLSLKTNIEPSSQLSLHWVITLDESHPSLTIVHKLTYHGTTPKTIAAWSLMAIPSSGKVTVENLAKQSDSIFPWQGPPLGTEAQYMEENQYYLNLDAPIHPYILRTGLNGMKSMFSYQNGNQRLESIADVDPNSQLSPPGINLLFYADVSPQEEFAELEHLGALKTLDSGDSIELSQSIRLKKTEPITIQTEAAKKPLVLHYQTIPSSLEVRADGRLERWMAPLQRVPVFLTPFDPSQTPSVESDSLRFNNTPMEIPRLASLQALNSKAARTIEIIFEPSTDTHSLQMLVEIGGSGNGYNLFLEEGYLCANVWGKLKDGSVESRVLKTPLKAGISKARLEIDPILSEARLVYNYQVQERIPLPKINPHRDRCALGGIAGTSRHPSGILSQGAAPYAGYIHELKIEMHPPSSDFSQ